MKKGKKGQFYIIAAVVIIFIIAGISTISNYVYTKEEPKKFYDLGSNIKEEGSQVYRFSKYNATENVTKNIENYLEFAAGYVNQNTNEEFTLVVIYGSAGSNNLRVKEYKKTELDSVYLGQYGFPDEQVVVTPGNVIVGSDQQTATVTYEYQNQTITQTVPILQDNNFVVIMTTSSGLNQYILNSENPQ